MAPKTYRAYFDSRLLNYKKYLETRDITEILLPNRHFTGGHLVDDFIWNKVSIQHYAH